MRKQAERENLGNIWRQTVGFEKTGDHFSLCPGDSRANPGNPDQRVFWFHSLPPCHEWSLGCFKTDSWMSICFILEQLEGIRRAIETKNADLTRLA
jgi:hypothetical protein